MNGTQLLAIMSACPIDKLDSYADKLSEAMAEFGINTLTRQAAFLGQIAQESGELRWWIEEASGRAYEHRADLGNTCPNDGPLFKGRSPIQLTGRANYREAGKALGVDLENKPDLALSRDVGFRIAAWFWSSHGCNELADLLQYELVTKRINGGLTAHALRLEYYHRALEVLGKDAAI
jgi:predicted chitinase